MSNEHQNGWNEYSKLVLKELTSLADSVDSINLEIQGVKQELAEMRAKEDRVDDLRSWKGKIDEVCSPSQLDALLKKVESLEAFKTKSVGVFIAVQSMMGVVLWIMKIL